MREGDRIGGSIKYHITIEGSIKNHIWLGAIFGADPSEGFATPQTGLYELCIFLGYL